VAGLRIVSGELAGGKPTAQRGWTWPRQLEVSRGGVREAVKRWRPRGWSSRGPGWAPESAAARVESAGPRGHRLAWPDRRTGTFCPISWNVGWSSSRGGRARSRTGRPAADARPCGVRLRQRRQPRGGFARSAGELGHPGSTTSRSSKRWDRKSGTPVRPCQSMTRGPADSTRGAGGPGAHAGPRLDQPLGRQAPSRPPGHRPADLQLRGRSTSLGSLAAAASSPDTIPQAPATPPPGRGIVRCRPSGPLRRMSRSNHRMIGPLCQFASHFHSRGPLTVSTNHPNDSPHVLGPYWSVDDGCVVIMTNHSQTGTDKLILPAVRSQAVSEPAVARRGRRWR